MIALDERSELKATVLEQTLAERDKARMARPYIGATTLTSPQSSPWSCGKCAMEGRFRDYSTVGLECNDLADWTRQMRIPPASLDISETSTDNKQPSDMARDGTAVWVSLMPPRWQASIDKPLALALQVSPLAIHVIAPAWRPQIPCGSPRDEPAATCLFHANPVPLGKIAANSSSRARGSKGPCSGELAVFYGCHWVPPADAHWRC